ncbi:hypothetical protein EV359DRAFT_79026 [Lentinula novae-zelandiae]|nr:hypothetical protein EV359DRAFT_79026 [Lentinula novae-zelandiae]
MSSMRYLAPSRSSGYHRYHPYQHAGHGRSSSMPPSSISPPSGSRPLFSHSRSPAPLRHAPPSYNPTKVVNDQLNSWDPDSVVSKFYADQAKFKNFWCPLIARPRLMSCGMPPPTVSASYLLLWKTVCSLVPIATPPATIIETWISVNRCLFLAMSPTQSSPGGVRTKLTLNPLFTEPVNLFNERKRALKAHQEEENNGEYQGEEDQDDKYEIADYLRGSGTLSQSITTSHLLHSFERDRDEDIVTADEDATYLTDYMCYTHEDLYSVSHLPKHIQISSWITPPNGLPLIPAAPPFTASPSATRVACSSRFTEEEAASRKLTDSVMISCVLTGADEGAYFECPYLHPAFKLSLDAVTPAALKIHEGPEAVQRIWSRTLRGTPITCTLLLLNSPTRISLELFAELRKRFHQCQSCLCYFSWDVYGKHLKGSGLCANTPALESVPNLDSVFGKLPGLPVDNWRELSKAIGKPSPILASPVGVAWMSWNSPYGVTHDAWANMITAWRRCPGQCGLVRTFDGHKAHMERERECAKEGDLDFMLWAY